MRLAVSLLLLASASVAQEGVAPVKTDAAGQLREADARFSAREYGVSKGLYEQAADAARVQGARSVEVEALAQLARCWSLPAPEPDLKRAREWLSRSAELAHPDDPAGWTRLLGVRGILEREEGDRPRALATFVEMYDYALARGLHRRAIDAAHHAAIVAPVAEQEAWARKGIAAAEAGKDTGWLAVLWNNLGATYEDQGRYADAVSAYTKAREYHHQGEREVPKLAADWALGHAHRLAGDLDAAERWLVPALAWAERLGEREWIGYCSQDLGEVDLARGRREQGLARLRAARNHLEVIRSHWPEGLAKLDERIAALERGE